MLTLDEKGLELEFTGSEEDFEGLKSFVKSSGFPNANIFKGVGKEAGKVIVYSGGFKYNPNALAAPTINKADKKKTTFEILRDEVLGTTPGSNLNSQQPNDGLKSSHGNAIASPTSPSIQR